jgi:large subunit ribosomal protein L9
VDGKLFGSVTNADIAAALVALGHNVEKTQVRMATGHLKQLGDHAVSIALHTDVAVDITVSITGSN